MLAFALESAGALLVTVASTDLCMSMTDTAASDTDVFDAVEIPASDSGVSLCFGDEMAQQGVRPEEP